MSILKQKENESFWKCPTGEGVQKAKTEEQNNNWNIMLQVIVKRRVQYTSSLTRLRPERCKSKKGELRAALLLNHIHVMSRHGSWTYRAQLQQKNFQPISRK